MYKKLLVLSTYIGTTIGVGLFGLPYVTAQAGFPLVLAYFLGLGLVLVFISLMYGEIALRTKNNHRLPGYSQIYVGKGLSSISHISTFIGLTGSLLAYIIIGGEFLASLLIPAFGGNTLLYTTIFFAASSTLIYLGSGPVSKTEFLSLGVMITVLLLMFIKALPNVDLTYFGNINLNNFFLPYGVVLFSLCGLTVIPEMVELLKGHERQLKPLLIIGTIVPAIVYLIFIVTIFGVTGPATTPEAMIGFNQHFGNGIAKLGFIFGLLTTFTSYLTLGITLRKQLTYDLGLRNWLAWLVACLPAYILFLLGLKNFIVIIAFIGSVTMGFDILTIFIVYFAAKIKSQRKPAYSLTINYGLAFILSLIFLTGIIIEISHLA